MDVLWFRLSASYQHPTRSMGRFDRGQIFVLIYRGDYWQCGYVIPKGTFERIRAAGLPAFRDRVARLMPMLAEQVRELGRWEDLSLLTVRVDRLATWYRPGLLCIGDAAHAMSPVGGVGINLAIQDAVAAANILAAPLAEGRDVDGLLDRVQRRRMLPTRIVQAMQRTAQNRLIDRIVLRNVPITRPPRLLRLMQLFPVLQRIPARMIGLGFRPEHVRSPEARGGA
jgi:2-polyprenyl-6-methoxyphenol hydroxylase-like FAD-dependent oxidoreductase